MNNVIRVSATEFVKEAVRYQDVALSQPVIVTRDGEDRMVMISADEYLRLKRRDREVLGIEDFTAADIEAIRKTATERCGIEMHDQILSSYLMYPDVFTAFNASIRTYGPVSVLPTPVYFYGMAPGDEIAVTIQEGKTLIIRLQTLSETDEEGNVRAFFELNGQPRVVVIPNRGAVAARPARRKADEADARHIGAPMPGSISAILVREDQQVTQGEPLLAIEAMKMEAQISAPRDGRIKTILVRVGEQLDAKDLVIEYA